MKTKIYNSFLLGASCAIVATASYAIIGEKAKPATSALELKIPTLSGDSWESTPMNVNILDAEADLKSVSKTIQYDWIIEPGDSLSTIFDKLGIHKDELNNLIHASEQGRLFETIATGNKLHVLINQEGQLEQLIYEKNVLESLTAIKDADHFIIEKRSKEVDHKTASATATIQNSLFLDGKKAGLSDKTIMQLAAIFAWDIDFALNLRVGDQITVLYEKLLVNGHEIDTGDILAAEVTNQGRTYTAVRYIDSKSNVRYYTPEGKSMRKAFLRTPVDFARISSRFNLKRKHPVLNRIRAHKGVDYAAKTGTPVKATGDGKIIFRGRKGGYGRVVIIQHGQNHSTLYAHLSRYGARQRVGSKIKQGQIIGRVGSSGLATGPHLHYEFRVNGKHRNPLTVSLPKSDPIKNTLLASFQLQTQPLLSQLNQARTTLVAENDISRGVQ